MLCVTAMRVRMVTHPFPHYSHAEFAWPRPQPPPSRFGRHHVRSTQCPAWGQESLGAHRRKGQCGAASAMRILILSRPSPTAPVGSV